MGVTAVPACHDENGHGKFPGIGFASFWELLELIDVFPDHDEHDVFDSGHLDPKKILAVNLSTIEIPHESQRSQLMALQDDAELVKGCPLGRIALWA